MPPSSSTALAAAAALPVILTAGLLLVIGGAGANAAPTSNVCAGGGTAQTVAGVRLDAEQMADAATIAEVTAARRLPLTAAVIAETTAYTESRLRNSATQADHDSEGLFQQRISLYTEAVAIDPVRATNAFLDRLLAVPGWARLDVAAVAQAVQGSQFPTRYRDNAMLGRAVTALLWPTAHATAPPPAGAPRSDRPAVCAGAGSAETAGGVRGGRGNVIAGTTSVPSGFVVTGTTAGRRAVQFALAQLGKPYVFGAAGPDTFDCSGLTMAAWASAGVALPHLAAAQTRAGTPQPPSLATAVGGDLVMIPGADGTPTEPGHVGMIAGYLPRPDGRHLYLIQAPTPGVAVELTEASEWSGQITDVRHIA